MRLQSERISGKMGLSSGNIYLGSMSSRRFHDRIKKDEDDQNGAETGSRCWIRFLGCISHKAKVDGSVSDSNSQTADPLSGMTLRWECEGEAHCIIEHHQGYLYLFTDGARDGQPVEKNYLVRSPVDLSHGPRIWEEIRRVDESNRLKLETPVKVPRCLSNSLRKVEDELEMIRYMLKHGSALEVMQITFSRDIKDPMIELVKEICEYPRKSPSCEIEFLGRTSNDKVEVCYTAWPLKKVSN